MGTRPHAINQESFHHLRPAAGAGALIPAFLRRNAVSAAGKPAAHDRLPHTTILRRSCCEIVCRVWHRRQGSIYGDSKESLLLRGVLQRPCANWTQITANAVFGER